jgi:hypothetical protein
MSGDDNPVVLGAEANPDESILAGATVFSVAVGCED